MDPNTNREDHGYPGSTPYTARPEAQYGQHSIRFNGSRQVHYENNEGPRRVLTPIEEPGIISHNESTFDDHSQRSLGILPTHDQKEHNQHNRVIEATSSQSLPRERIRYTEPGKDFNYQDHRCLTTRPEAHGQARGHHASHTSGYPTTTTTVNQEHIQHVPRERMAVRPHLEPDHRLAKGLELSHGQAREHRALTYEQWQGPASISREAEFDALIARTQHGMPPTHSQKEDSHVVEATFSQDHPRERQRLFSTRLVSLQPHKTVMPNHPSYHGDLDGKEAEKRLLQKSMSLGSNCYLTRYSKSQSSYVVSAIVFHQGTETPVHIKLIVDNDNNRYSLDGTEKIFSTLDELLEYFKRTPLNAEIRGLGTPCLPPDKSQHGTLPRPKETKKKKICSIS